MSDSKQINKYAKAAIRLEPNKRDCPWMLGKANNDSFEKQLLIRKPRYIDELLSIRDIYNILGNKEKEIETFDCIIKCLKEEWNSKEEDSQLKDMIQARNKLL